MKLYAWNRYDGKDPRPYQPRKVFRSIEIARADIIRALFVEGESIVAESVRGPDRLVVESEASYVEIFPVEIVG